MRKYICLLVLCLASICAMAQETRELKQIKLKSGLIISGYVTNNTDGSISVTTADGDQLYYQSSEVQSISEDPIVAESRRKVEEDAKELAKAEKRVRKDAIKMKEKGFQIFVEVGGVPGEDNTFMMKVAPCYRFNKHFLAGIGLGGCESKGGFATTIVRYNILKYRVSPFFGMSVGYAAKGFIAEGETGCMFRTRRGNGLHIGLYISNYTQGGYALKMGWTF